MFFFTLLGTAQAGQVSVFIHNYSANEASLTALNTISQQAQKFYRTLDLTAHTFIQHDMSRDRRMSDAYRDYFDGTRSYVRIELTEFDQRGRKNRVGVCAIQFSFYNAFTQEVTRYRESKRSRNEHAVGLCEELTRKTLENYHRSTGFLSSL